MLKPLATLLYREALLEWRTRDLLLAAGLFAALVILILAFGVAPREAGTMPNVQAAALWIAFAFAGTLALNRAFARDRESGALEGLMLAPIDWSLIYVAKAVAGTAFTLIANSLALLCFTLFFPVPLTGPHLALLLGLMALGTAGHMAVGLLLSALTVSLRAREVLLPVLLFPLLIPLFLGAVTTTESVLRDARIQADLRVADASPASTTARELDTSDTALFRNGWWRWVLLQIAYTVVFSALGLLLFPLVIRE